MSSDGPVVGLTNGYIYTFLKEQTRKASRKSPKFTDVYSADMVPPSLLDDRQREYVCVCNLSESTERGTHFVTLHITPKTIKVYDSLALNLKLASPELERRLRTTRKTVRHAFQQPLQRLSSSMCGFYAIMFVLCLTYSPPQDLLEDFLELLKAFLLQLFQ